MAAAPSAARCQCDGRAARRGLRFAEEHALYRCLDQFVRYKGEPFKFPKRRWREPFGARFEVLLYELTSTCFGTDSERGAGHLPPFGSSRDKRSDCRQVVLALIVTPEGLPLSYQVMTANTVGSRPQCDTLDRSGQHDGRAARIWVTDRGIVTVASPAKMRAVGARHLMGTPKGRLTRLERAPLPMPWAQTRAGVRVKRLFTAEDVYRLAQRLSRDQRLM